MLIGPAEDPMTWPSLVDQLALAEELFGERGAVLVADWLERQTARVDDPEFARGFADHVDLPGVPASDFTHRLVLTSSGRLLGGIRFYGRDVGRPFVDVIAHDFEGLDELRDCVRTEWSTFTPGFLRLYGRPGAVACQGVSLDTTIHVARYRDMPASERAVVLAPFDDVAQAAVMVGARYGVLAPELRSNVSPADADDLLAWHAAGQLRAARVDDATVGLLAVAPGAINWIDGDEIMEEVVDVQFRSLGYATAMQCEWARSVAVDRDRLLIGTIDRHNAPSRRTAERAGRPGVLDALFVDLAS